jgi:hypothetical protein
MMGIQIIGPSGTIADVDPYRKALRVAPVARGVSYAISSVTGTMAAALSANSSVFAMRLDPAAGSTYKAYIERMRIQFTTIVAFTTPVTANRRLALYRGSGAAASGGTALAAAAKKDTADGNSQFNSGEGGDMRIATTAGLTVTGITYETQEIRTMTLVHVGAAGAHYECVWEFGATDASGPAVLNQGELWALRNPVVFDAAGTWQLGVNVDWHEGTI